MILFPTLFLLCRYSVEEKVAPCSTAVSAQTRPPCRWMMGLRWRPIDVEPTLAYLPGIIGSVTVWEHRVVAVAILRIDPEVHIFTQLAAVPHAAKAAFLGPASCREQPSLRIPGLLGDDIDAPVDRVGPHRVAAGPPMTSMRSIASSRVSC